MSKFNKFFQRTIKKFIIVFMILFYATIFINTISLLPSATATLTALSKPFHAAVIQKFSSGLIPTNNETLNSHQLQPTDNYLLSNKKDCIKSKRFFSCVKYRATNFIWSLATNGFKYFDSSNSKSFVDINQNNDDDDDQHDDDDDQHDDDNDDNYNNKKHNNKRRNFDNSTIVNKQNNLQLRFVYLNAPSDIQLFEETRTFQGDGEISKAIKFVKRAAQTFVQNHGLQVSLDSLGGFQVSRGGKNYITGRGHHKEVKKRLKFAILLPIIILVKLFHFKITVIPLLFVMNGLNLLLIAGGTYILYYLKHHTVCKIKPQVSETHSHVWDHIPTEFRGHKKTKKKLKWLILFPLIILGKIASLKMSMVVLMFTVIGAQLALAGGFAFIIYWLKHTYLCKINPKWAETVSGPTWEQENGHYRRSFDVRTYVVPIDYSSFAYQGGEHSPFSIGNKDWASSKAYNAYNYLDTISRPV